MAEFCAHVKDRALYRVNPKGERPGVFKCRECIDGVPRISLNTVRPNGELLDVLLNPPPEQPNG